MIGALPGKMAEIDAILPLCKRVQGSWSTGDAESDFSAWLYQSTVRQIHEETGAGQYGSSASDYYYDALGKLIFYHDEKQSAIVDPPRPPKVQKVEISAWFDTDGTVVWTKKTADGKPIEMDQFEIPGAVQRERELRDIAESDAAQRAQPKAAVTRVAFENPDSASRVNAIFAVPISDVTEYAGRGLNYQELHTAEMLGVTNSWCQGKSFDTRVDWHYLTEGGKKFRGLIPITCRSAALLFRIYGTGKPETRQVEYNGKVRTEEVPALNLNNSRKVLRFQDVAQDFHMGCVDKLCPGDPLP